MKKTIKVSGAYIDVSDENVFKKESCCFEIHGHDCDMALYLTKKQVKDVRESLLPYEAN